jgi:hypothetical protein
MSAQRRRPLTQSLATRKGAVTRYFDFDIE